MKESTETIIKGAMMHDPYRPPETILPSQVDPAEVAKVSMLPTQLAVLGLILGSVLYIVFALTLADRTQLAMNWDDLMTGEYGGFFVIILSFSYLVPYLISRYPPARLSPRLEGGTAVIFKLYQAQLAIGVASLLGVVFHSSNSFLNWHEATDTWNYAFLLVAVAFEGVIIHRFPTRKRFAEWWIWQQRFGVLKTA